MIPITQAQKPFPSDRVWTLAAVMGLLLVGVLITRTPVVAVPRTAQVVLGSRNASG